MYSFVTDQNQVVTGIWLKNKSDVEKNYLGMLCVKHTLPSELYTATQEGKFRVVPNHFNKAGGVYVMFGSALAPGENDKKWWQFWMK